MGKTIRTVVLVAFAFFVGEASSSAVKSLPCTMLDYSADNSNCEDYYQCNLGGTSWIRGACPGNQIFNPNTNRCVSSSSYACPYDSTESSSATEIVEQTSSSQSDTSATSTITDEDYCSQVKCLNGGSCVNGERGEVSCECADGFVGIFCQIAVDCTNFTCYNGGKCTIQNGTQRVCECPEGASGKYCERRNSCGGDGVGPCQNGGHCCDSEQGFVCSCTFGWTGMFCDVPRKCSQSGITCENGGECVDSDTSGAQCECPATFKGVYCQVKKDSCGGCENGGVCKLPEIFDPSTTTEANYTCACPKGFTGERCEIASNCTIPCSERVGQNGPRYQVAIYPDLKSDQHAYMCREGLVQRVHVCPETRYNFYSMLCLTEDQMEAADTAMATSYYPDAQ